ncbi:MAG: hypothetical protein RL641_591 [Candidatus Parcubacteria bacterium]
MVYCLSLASLRFLFLVGKLNETTEASIYAGFLYFYDIKFTRKTKSF